MAKKDNQRQRHRQGAPGQGPARLPSAIHRLSREGARPGQVEHVRELKDSPQVRGLINTVHYLVRVEE